MIRNFANTSIINYLRKTKLNELRALLNIPVFAPLMFISESTLLKICRLSNRESWHLRAYNTCLELSSQKLKEAGNGNSAVQTKKLYPQTEDGPSI